MKKLKVAILGSGNIGTDLMYKLRKSEILELTSVFGIDPDSDGLKQARELGYEAFSNGIEDFLQRPELADIVFDATSAKAHIRHAKKLREIGKQVLDLTPAAVGPFVVPPVNITEHLEAENINLITCGGQATIPIVHAINRIQPVSYAEIVATISSRSAGPGTRPVGPEKVEVWCWFFIDKAAPESYKREAYKGYLGSFGPTGTLEQDDTETWARIVEVSSGTMMRNKELSYNNVSNYLMGFNRVEPDESFPGPGTAYPTTYLDALSRSMHETWLEYISESAYVREGK